MIKMPTKTREIPNPVITHGCLRGGVYFKVVEERDKLVSYHLVTEKLFLKFIEKANLRVIPEITILNELQKKNLRKKMPPLKIEIAEPKALLTTEMPTNFWSLKVFDETIHKVDSTTRHRISKKMQQIRTQISHQFSKQIIINEIYHKKRNLEKFPFFY